MTGFGEWMRERYSDSHNPMHDEEYDLANLAVVQHERLKALKARWPIITLEMKDATDAAEEFQEKYSHD